MIHIDTQIAIWTHLALRRKISKTAQRALENTPLVFSPMLRLELNLLHEKGLLPASSPIAVIYDLIHDFGASESQAEWSYIIDIAADQVRWTRDPFDRLIVANAIADNAKLVTADGEIIDHFKDAVW